MAEPREHLPRAPITEAVVDFRLKPRHQNLFSSIDKLCESFDGYEKQGPIFHVETNLSLEAKGPKSETKSQNLGFRLQSPDRKYVLQCRAAGLTISRLEPYEHWETLTAEARRVLEIFVEATQPEAVTRVATRFINRLNLPMKPNELFEDYLTEPPGVPKELPQGVAGFKQRVVVVNPEIDAQANIVQFLQEGFPATDGVPVILDIDAYSMVEMPPDAESVWNRLELLRSFKNAAFYASITEKTAKLYE